MRGHGIVYMLYIRQVLRTFLSLMHLHIRLRLHTVRVCKCLKSKCIFTRDLGVAGR